MRPTCHTTANKTKILYFQVTEELPSLTGRGTLTNKVPITFIGPREYQDEKNNTPFSYVENLRVSQKL